jgi:hypothetical protein
MTRRKGRPRRAWIGAATLAALSLATPGALGRPLSEAGAPLVSPRAFVTGHYPVAYLLCDFSNWHYEPNSLSYYRKLWIDQHPTGTYSSLADFFHDVSFGQMDMTGSTVLGWFHMSVNPETWYTSIGGINNQRLSSRWLDCVNAAEASGQIDLGTKEYRAVVVVTPYVKGKITGKGLAAQPKLTKGQKTPAPETMTVDSTKGWPQAPFMMSLPDTKAFPYGENVRVSKVKGHTLTVYRGYNEGVSQLPGPFAAMPAGGKVTVDSDDDFGAGPQTMYDQQGAQPCTGPVPVPPNTFCPKIFLSRPSTVSGPAYETLHIGVANLFAGDNKHDGNVNVGIGDSAHEVGHATGYNHSRALSSSTTDYNDCFDQMSYNCGLSGLPGEAGPPDGVIGYDAINLEFHGWIPSSAIEHVKHQETIQLHALSDPRALAYLGGAYLEAQIPAKVKIEDTGEAPDPTDLQRQRVPLRHQQVLHGRVPAAVRIRPVLPDRCVQGARRSRDPPVRAGLEEPERQHLLPRRRPPG